MAGRPALLRAAGAVSAAVFSSRITGLVREVVMARLFGAGQAYDAFLLAMRVPNLLRNLFAEGALSSAFVPVFSETLSAHGRRETVDLSNRVATALVLSVGVLCLAGMVFSPQLVALLAPGFSAVPGKFELAVLLMRIMFPFLLLVALAAQAMGVLNACGSFGVPAMASTFFNIGSVVCGLVLGFTVGRASGQGLIVSMAAGVVFGGALQLGWQLPSLQRAGFAFRPRLDFGDERLRRIFRLMLPAFLGTAALQINVIVNTSLASTLKDTAGNVIDGPVSWLGYAFRFLQLPVGLFGAAFASATLPELARSVTERRMGDYRATLSHSLGTVLLMTIPSSVGLAVLGRSIIGAVFEWGAFRPLDTAQTAAALAGYSVGLAGYAAIKLLAPAFFALADGKTPAAVSVASVAVNLAASWMLVKWAGMGHAGLALSTSVVALVGAAALFSILHARVGGFATAGLARTMLGTAAASAVMGAACLASSAAVRAVAGSGKPAQLADVAISIPVGLAVFYAVARAFGVAELEALRNACYTAFRNASRPEVGHPPARNR